MARQWTDTPAWDQMADGDPTWAAQDCGFECMAMANYTIKRSRPNIMEGTYRQVLGQLEHLGLNRPGLTTASDLRELATFLGLATQVRADSVSDAMTNWNHYLAANQASIILGNWDLIGLHWMLLLASPIGPTWVVNDPNGGLRKAITDKVVMQRYAGSYLRILSTPDSLP